MIKKCLVGHSPENGPFNNFRLYVWNKNFPDRSVVPLGDSYSAYDTEIKKFNGELEKTDNSTYVIWKNEEDYIVFLLTWS